jgi:hypothetical protein
MARKKTKSSSVVTIEVPGITAPTETPTQPEETEVQETAIEVPSDKLVSLDAMADAIGARHSMSDSDTRVLRNEVKVIGENWHGTAKNLLTIGVTLATIEEKFGAIIAEETAHSCEGFFSLRANAFVNLMRKSQLLVAAFPNEDLRLAVAQVGSGDGIVVSHVPTNEKHRKWCDECSKLWDATDVTAQPKLGRYLSFSPAWAKALIRCAGEIPAADDRMSKRDAMLLARKLDYIASRVRGVQQRSAQLPAATVETPAKPLEQQLAEATATFNTAFDGFIAKFGLQHAMTLAESFVVKVESIVTAAGASSIAEYEQLKAADAQIEGTAVKVAKAS